MAIINQQREVDLSTVLTTSYINLPVTAGISPTGYWYYYTPANANNTILGSSITPYKWDQKLPLKDSASTMVIDGTMPLITESWDGANVRYHGGTIEWVGPGINNVTNANEDDAFFFGHMGATTTSPSNDIFYWDRAFEPEAGSDWEYYQYHQHSPTFYASWENGRQTLAGDGWIDPGDKAYGYLITSQVRVSGVNYASVLARIHTPSIGGAHNSHNDVTLPTTANKNYMPGGILRGIGERFHAFYITANGSDWDVFTRTYTDTAQSFGPQTLLGTFDLANPSFNPTANQQSQYPVRASCGTSFGARIYFPVILNNSVSGFDLEIWSFNSLDTIAGGSLIRTVLVSGVSARPDCFLAVLGTTALYALFTDVTTGGTRLWKYDGTTWSDSGAFLTNNSADPVRVHGFDFNSQDFRFYALLSGTASGGGTYLGPGLYSFQLDDVFAGYTHLDYDASSNSFVERGPLTTGYLKYQPSLAQFTRVNEVEPQAIAADTTILDYAPPRNQWYNRKQVGFGGKDFYYEAITLSDGRRFACGQITDNPDNQGAAGSGDFLVSIYTADLSQAVHLAAGTTGDDYLTGAFESTTQKRVWMTGYCKGAVVPKGDIWIHGWCRNLSDGGSALEYTDMAVDSDGNVYLVGKHVDGWLVITKYDKNYVLKWQKRYGQSGNLTNIGFGIAVDGTTAVYVCGQTEEGPDAIDALLIKVNPETGNPVWAKIYGTAGSATEIATSVAVISDSGTKRIVTSVVTATTTTFLSIDTDGNIVEQNVVTDLVVNRVRPNQTDSNSGRFLFAGNDGGVTTVGKIGMCELDSATRFVQWICSVDATDEVDLKDFINTDTDGGSGAPYVACGAVHHDGILIEVLADETSPGNWTVTKNWSKTLNLNPGAVDPCMCSFNSLCSTPYTESEIYIYVAGSAMGPVSASMGMEEAILMRFTAAGVLDWQNGFGHDMDEAFVSIALDSLGRNVIAAGWSESHSDSRDAIFFRAAINGFGTGVYNYTETGTAPYFYNKSNYSVITNVDTFTQDLAPSDQSASFITTSYSIVYESSDYLARDFDGAFGPNGLFTGIIAYLDLDKYQEFLNTDEYKQQIANGQSLIYISNPNLIGGFYQYATVGDGSADDGNIFGYDIIEHSNGKVYVIGQTSGDITQTNLGSSGVYDYLLVELDPATGNLEFYQNGTNFDEETYALTELANGKIAYTGRTTGPLGSPNQGGYDIFLGIFDPTTETSTYYSTGSGLDDAGLNIHDLGNNELAIAYYSYGSLAGTTNSGSQDLGVVKFNYNTNSWGTAYQTGSSTSELYLQNGRPSTLLSNKRIAITTSTAGVFADNAVTYGFLDIALAILDLNTGTWSKYQVGTTANEIASSATNAGDTILISGNQGGSFTDDIDAVFVEFDALEAVSARSSSV